MVLLRCQKWEQELEEEKVYNSRIQSDTETLPVSLECTMNEGMNSVLGYNFAL